jgi:hypothetical protein
MKNSNGIHTNKYNFYNCGVVCPDDKFLHLGVTGDRAENVKVEDVMARATRYVFNLPLRWRHDDPKRQNHSPLPHPQNTPKHKNLDC